MPEEQDIEVGDSEESAVDVAISDENEQGKPVRNSLVGVLLLKLTQSRKP